MTEVTYSSEGGIPRTEDDCERVLDAADAATASPEFSSYPYLASFLGASSRLWTSARRNRLRVILARAGVEVTSPVLQAVARTPRQEVIDDAIDVLDQAAIRDERVVRALAGRLLIHDPLVRDHAAVRATIARVLGRHRELGTREVRLVALARALLDPAAEVRDAAIQALGDSRDPVAMRLLEQRRPNEEEAFLLDAIDDALAALRGQ
jgi:hypothetical protein